MFIKNNEITCNVCKTFFSFFKNMQSKTIFLKKYNSLRNKLPQFKMIL